MITVRWRLPLSLLKVKRYLYHSNMLPGNSVPRFGPCQVQSCELTHTQRTPCTDRDTASCVHTHTQLIVIPAHTASQAQLQRARHPTCACRARCAHADLPSACSHQYIQSLHLTLTTSAEHPLVQAKHIQPATEEPSKSTSAIVQSQWKRAGEDRERQSHRGCSTSLWKWVHSMKKKYSVFLFSAF